MKDLCKQFLIGLGRNALNSIEKGNSTFDSICRDSIDYTINQIPNIIPTVEIKQQLRTDLNVKKKVVYFIGTDADKRNNELFGGDYYN